MLVRKRKPAPPKETANSVVPSGEYMCAAQLTFFRCKLEAEKRTILERAQNTLDSMQNNEPRSDPNDRATTEEEYLLEFRVRDRERKLLKKIDEALIRIDEGTYGWCAETGEPIGIPRLLARPTAALCIEAQERREMNNWLYDD